MVSIQEISVILILHYVFDWLAQTRWQAENKSKDLWALTSHVGVYALSLPLMTAIAASKYGLSTEEILAWSGVNALLHWNTDFITSRINAKLYQNYKRAFWSCIGGDQLIHYLTLFWTYYYLIS